MLMSKADMTKVISLLVESLNDFNEDDMLDLSMTAEQSFKLDGTGQPGAHDEQDRFVQVIFLPGSQEIFDRMPDPIN